VTIATASPSKTTAKPGRRSAVRAVAIGTALALAGTRILVSLTVRASAQDGVDPLLATGSSDPLELARVVDRIGDAALLERLGGEGTPTDVRLAAIRASVALRAPERALEPLATIARSRDPDLAPAAAMAFLAIARDLDPRALDAREVLRGELVPARTALEALADDESARADLRRAALLALDALTALGVPSAQARPSAGSR
jgi:hypothetical protein